MTIAEQVAVRQLLEIPQHIIEAECHQRRRKVLDLHLILQCLPVLVRHYRETAARVYSESSALQGGG